MVENWGILNFLWYYYNVCSCTLRGDHSSVQSSTAWVLHLGEGFFAHSMKCVWIHRLEMCKGRSETFQQFWCETDHSCEHGESLTSNTTCSLQIIRMCIWRWVISPSSQRIVLCSLQFQRSVSTSAGRLHFLQRLCGLPPSYVLVPYSLTLRLRIELQAWKNSICELLWLLRIYC